MPYMTNHKKRILDFLIDHKDRHYTIDEIIQGLDGDTKPGKSTVYRQISSLLEDGYILKNGDEWEIKKENHYES